MRIVVLGATGQTGQYLVNQALHQGHVVTAVARNPGKMTVMHDKLQVVEGNIFSEESLKPLFKDHDAVISCLGFPASAFSGVTGYTQSMKAVIGAMRETKMNRLIAMTSCVLTNMYEMENFLKDTDDINWTVVRPPGLKNESATAKEILTHEGYFVPDERGSPIGQTIARGDVARFMLSLLNSNAWVKKGVAMITK
ncbi:uncharacterized protein LOC114789220 isoform X2 [Denticeps clupeoides]|uniref:uncharacterized protein LOC114789220 isoform X2 n=1 Tax=Denticeps clupeoides TaxID=299321 RepID=UPI0010A352C2|nr:uncharacterized protein LOC114789220 isoform X2 [Denticeps clupeoides]